MTRPMPYTEAPPHPGRSPKFSGDDVGHEERLAAREAWDDARWKYTESIVVGRDKRLTDAECAAHYWQADGECLALDNALIVGWSNHETVTNADTRAETWKRFMDTTHALEEA